MKRLLKKILIGTLGMSMLLLSACGDSVIKQDSLGEEQNKEVAMGRYIEQNLDFPNVGEGFVIGLCQTEEGIELYTYEEGIKLYHLVEGAWIEQEVLWKEAYSQLETGWHQGTIWKEQDDFYFAYCTANEAITDIYVVRDGQNIERLNIQWSGEDGYRTPETMDVLPNGDIIVADAYTGVERYSGEDGKFIRAYGDEVVSFAIIEDKIYQIELKESTIKSYEIETGKLVETIPCENVDGESKLVAGKDGDLYLAHRQGVSHLVKGGSIWETVVAAEMTSFGMPSLYCSDFIVDGEDYFVLFNGALDGYQLKNYTYSKDTPSKPTTEVVLYMLEEDVTFRQAAAQYQVSHPEVQVSIQVGYAEGSAITKTEAIRALNTQLLAGKGPDLFVLDDLPIEDYIEKGILEDMSEWTQPFIEQEIWLPSVAKGYEKEGAIYALPTRFTVPTIWGDEKVIHDAQDLYGLAAWAKEHPSEKVLSYESEEQLIRQFYLSTAPVWRDEKGYIEEDKFTKFLEAIKVLAQEGLQEEEEIVWGKRGESQHFGMNIDSLMDVAYHETEVYLMAPESMRDIMFGIAGNEKRGKGGFARLGDQEDGVFIPNAIVGVNAQSNQKEIARGIIETTLSEEVQATNLNNGFAVNQKALEASAHQPNDVAYSISDPKGRVLEVFGVEDVTIKEMEKFLELCQTVKYPVMVDELLIQIIVEETKSYFEDEMTAKEATQAVSSRVRAYLAE